MASTARIAGLEPVHHRHLDVHQDEIERRREALDGDLPVLGDDHLVADLDEPRTKHRRDGSGSHPPPESAYSLPERVLIS